ncbi:dTDP-4-dehydrorhamnose reductase [Antarctobacter sp.]|uniref:dTDP-4-dehydrorhamnose reductase n=1 Tax=Antarctobacter sp. TaxID=1872577 RepID=UPI002B26900D|nr:dTDP-4-dehydrorhamnose reductase [Antarctobacter sp.]
MKVLVFGKTGQVATELARRVPDDVEAVLLGRDAADLTAPAKCAAEITARKPDLVINAAAYTAVDKAEEDEHTARVVNGEAPAAMASACAEAGIPFLHISTDYVFDGTGETPRAVDAATGPLGAYGRTKLEGEQGIQNTNAAFAILRTSWVFSAHGGNFVKTMLRLSETRDKLTIVADQVGGPTEAGDIAAALWAMALAFRAGKGVTGTYHFSGAPDVNWADFAREIFARAGRTVEVENIPTSAYPTPAKRPANSRLDCSDLARDYGISRPDWRAALDRVLQELERVKA